MWWPVRPSLILLIVAMLTSCERSDVDYDDYLSRLERVLETERSSFRLTPPLKPQRHLFEIAPSNRYGLYESFALRPCGVMTLIGEHNAQMGKLAPPSQQLLYHHQIGHLLEVCDETTLDPAGKKMRQLVLSDKRRLLPSYSARLMLLSDEVWQNLDASSSASSHTNSVVEQSLRALVELKMLLSDTERSMPKAGSRLEQALSTLHYQRQPRQMHRAMLNAIEGLTQATQLIASRKPTFCGTPKFTILNNVLHQIYAKRIQPKLASIQRADREISPALQQLLSPWPDQPYFHFYLSQEPNSLRGLFNQSIRDHTKAWQQLLGQCNAKPQGESYVMSQVGETNSS